MMRMLQCFFVVFVFVIKTLRSFVFTLDDVEKFFHDVGVELLPTLFIDVGNGLIQQPCFAMGAVSVERVPNIYNGENARRKWNIFACQTVGISAAIPVFVMLMNEFERGGWQS